VATPATAPECEGWFLSHGLPWFVRSEDERIARALGWRRLTPVVVPAVLLSVVAGVLFGLAAGTWTALVLAGLYAATVLRGSVIARWAARRTVAEVGVVLPLITRALPLLLLFTTFLFINAEVWQVASSLSRSVLWTAVLLFAGVAVAFLLVRLPEELRSVTDRIAGDGQHPDRAELSGRQRANLLLVLLISQSLQVLMLSAAVFAFFVAFGLVAIQPEIVASWTGRVPQQRVWDALGVRVELPVSDELFQVSVFLAAFSGFYFTVYAVSDQNYRDQFFTRISRQLERAVEVHAAYAEALRRGSDLE
jgi:hypothetical protein